MDLAYAAADIIISRAGASSVSELCVVGKPVIFIPSPNVSEDHQTKNALAVNIIKNDSLYIHSDTITITGPDEKKILKGQKKRIVATFPISKYI